jgi:endonuclease YncB( thermonuclease family)
MSVSISPIENLALCSTQRFNASDKSCIVDGDTLWLNGVNVRLKDFDTPESHRNICGSFVEIDLAYVATNRLQELLNGNVWTIETFGIDGTGERRLATIKINGEDVGDILIREGLARRWPDGPEFWCE